MTRVLKACGLMAIVGFWELSGFAIAAHKPQETTFPISGHVSGFRLAGLEPDGDPLYQTVLVLRLSPAGGLPAVNLIANAYLENFKPDTTPILPDLLNPTHTATNLGGFLDGKALLTDNAGDAVLIGSFLAEAFLDNSNHAVIRLAGNGTGNLRGRFTLKKDGSLTGTLQGNISLSASALSQIRAHRHAKMRPLKQVISVVSVQPHAMMGRSTSPSASTVPLHTAYGTTKNAAPLAGYTAGTSGGGGISWHISAWTVVSALGAIASLILGVILFWSERKRTRSAL
jgi:hypothetical protein